LFVAVASCCGPTVRGPSTQPADPVHLDWTVRGDGESLEVSYTVTNNLRHRIWLLDEFDGGDHIVRDRLIVRNDGPGVIGFVAAYSKPDPNVEFEFEELLMPGGACCLPTRSLS
jgi:hypothetical protein